MYFSMEQNPHIRRKDTLQGMMLDVLIALSPVVIFALIVYQMYALRNILVSVATMVLVDVVVLVIKNLIAKRKNVFEGMNLAFFLVPCVSGLIYALITPATFWKADYSGLNAANAWADGYAYLVLVVGALFGSIVGKYVFSLLGGTGKNILNPAATGFVFSKFVFGARYAVDQYASSIFGTAMTGATTLHLNGGSTRYAPSAYTWERLGQLLIGETGGLMGETCKIAILIGLVYLLVRHTVDWRTVASFFGTLIVGLLVVGIVVSVYSPGVNPFMFMLVQLFSGGVLFGGVYMITDPVTNPVTKPSRVLFGMIIAICTLFFRYLVAGGEHYIYEGMAFSILIGNALVPLLDLNKWNSNEFNKSNIIFLSVLPVAMLVILGLSLSGSLGVFKGSHYVPPVSSSGDGSASTGASEPWTGLVLPTILGLIQ